MVQGSGTSSSGIRRTSTKARTRPICSAETLRSYVLQCRASAVVCCMSHVLQALYRVSCILYFPVFALCFAPGTFALVCVARRLRLSAALHQDEGTSMCNSARVLGHVCMPRARVAALTFGPASLRAAGRAACTLSCGRALRLHAGAGRCCDCGVSCAAAGLRSCGAAAASPPLPCLAVRFTTSGGRFTGTSSAN